MYLPVPERRRYTAGKYLRASKALRKRDQTAEPIEMPPSLQEYYTYMLKNGLDVNGLVYARFRLKNGLPYCGLVAKELVPANRILLKVPERCLLTTRHAWMSEARPQEMERDQGFKGILGLQSINELEESATQTIQ